MTCELCRQQYEENDRSDQVPCDIDKCKYNPSPGDISEDGCGLHPDNAFAVWFYDYWKRFGSTAFELIDIQLNTVQAAKLLDDLSTIDSYAPLIQRAAAQRGANIAATDKVTQARKHGKKRKK